MAFICLSSGHKKGEGFFSLLRILKRWKKEARIFSPSNKTTVTTHCYNQPGKYVEYRTVTVL